MKITKKALEAKVREQEIEIAGLKAKLELLMTMLPGPAIAPIAPVILPPVVTPQPHGIPYVSPSMPGNPMLPWDGTPIITCEVGSACTNLRGQAVS